MKYNNRASFWVMHGVNLLCMAMKGGVGYTTCSNKIKPPFSNEKNGYCGAANQI